MESGRIYTWVCVFHWRTYRKKKIWISPRAAEKINDSFREKSSLHAHTIGAAQQGFYKACKTTREARKTGAVKTGAVNAKFPYRRKRFRTTIWKNTAIKQKSVLTLSNGKGNRKIEIRLPEGLRNTLLVLEVRLVFEKKARKYFRHIVVENGRKPEAAPGNNTVSVDLGEIHPAVIGDDRESVLITCRELRHEKQGRNKRLGRINKAISRKKKGSRKAGRLIRTRMRLRACSKIRLSRWHEL